MKKEKKKKVMVMVVQYCWLAVKAAVVGAVGYGHCFRVSMPVTSVLRRKPQRGFAA